MSDSSPEDLYEALRKRLADYGQEPPPELWAGIRQQLPPPVASPRRRRWRAGLLLLSLLAVVASVATWQWQRTGTPSGTVARQAASAETAGNARPMGSKGPAPAVGTARAGAAETDAATGSVGASTNPANAASAAAALNPETAADGSSAGAIAAASPSAEAATSGGATLPAPAKSVTSAVARLKAMGSRTTRRKRTLAWAGINPDASTAGQRHPLRSARSIRTGREATAMARAGNEAALRTAHDVAPGAAAQGTPVASASASPSTAPAGAATMATMAASASGAARDGIANSTAGRKPAQGQLKPGSATVLTANAQPAGWDWLAARLVGLPPAEAAPLPAAQAVEVAPLPPLAPVVASRWAVQLVGGPGLTYRHIGSASLATASFAPAPSVISTNAFGGVSTTSAGSVADLERPALGYGAQLSIRRTLTPYWSVSAGLGYAEYATRLALQQVTVASAALASLNVRSFDSLSLSNSTRIHQRDTYRFATVPLRVGYSWTAGPRWQVGLLGGMDAAIYLGGTTTEGNDCACQTQTWSASGSPYRSLSLAASLGGEVRYRLAGPWQLLAQPTASYMLTPLAKPLSGYSIRHLVAGTALLGVSYDLP